MDHLLIASPLQPVGQEGLHELIQDLTGDQQGGQTLRANETQDQERQQRTGGVRKQGKIREVAMKGRWVRKNTGTKSDTEIINKSRIDKVNKRIAKKGNGRKMKTDQGKK